MLFIQLWKRLLILHVVRHQLETVKQELAQNLEAAITKEKENQQLKETLQAESRQMDAIRAEMDQLRETFKAQETKHSAELSNLKKSHNYEVSRLREEMDERRAGSADGQLTALEQVSDVIAMTTQKVYQSLAQLFRSVEPAV